jgi:hypothetical protein
VPWILCITRARPLRDPSSSCCFGCLCCKQYAYLAPVGLQRQAFGLL